MAGELDFGLRFVSPVPIRSEMCLPTFLTSIPVVPSNTLELLVDAEMVLQDAYLDDGLVSYATGSAIAESYSVRLSYLWLPAPDLTALCHLVG